MTSGTTLSQHCLQAWISCEDLLSRTQSAGWSLSERTRSVINECAQVCLGTMEALRAGAATANRFALLCLGICAECAEVCSRYPDSDFHFCAEACSACALALTQIADL